MKEEITTLFRPVGQAELNLVRASGFREFPPRLPGQLFFYPVLNEEYAREIAREWNTKDEQPGFVGHVLRFDVRSQYLREYEIHTVGASVHREYWIPAERVGQLNANIIGLIEIVAEFNPG
jgi:hypothetical protein